MGNSDLILLHVPVKTGPDGLTYQFCNQPLTHTLSVCFPGQKEGGGEQARRQFWRTTLLLVFTCKAILEYDVAGKIGQLGWAERDNSSNVWSLDIHSSVIHQTGKPVPKDFYILGTVRGNVDTKANKSCSKQISQNQYPLVIRQLNGSQ